MPTSGRRVESVADPSHQGRHGLVDVDHVVAAGAQLAVHRGDTVGRDREVRDGAVGLEAHGPSKRHEVIGRLYRLWPGTPMQTRRKAARRIERGEHADVVALLRGTVSASASMCLVTPPGYVHEYGETSAMRIIWILVPLRSISRSPKPLLSMF